MCWTFWLVALFLSDWVCSFTKTAHIHPKSSVFISSLFCCTTLGYVPVVNRGQKDINSAKSIKKALDDERQFFESHPAYASKAQYCGTPFLARKLNLVLPF